MSAKKKRRQLPEEDLAAAVAEIINSPITRSNLSFLRPLGTPASSEEDEQRPMGLDIKPMGVSSSPMGYDLRPMGDATTVVAPEALPLVLDVEPAATVVAEAEPESQPMGLDSSPMGFELTPMGLAPEVISDERPEAQPSPAPARTFWQAEGNGTLIEQTRVRRIYQAQDALSLVEEKVYDLLWGTKNQRRDDFRLVHYSLQRISSEARINIRTVRELIPRLIEKGFIQVEHEADAKRNTATLYRVSSYSSVLSDQKRRSRLYVAKAGKGVVYVHPMSAALAPSDPKTMTPRPMGYEQSPMGLGPVGHEQTPMGPAPMGLDQSPMGLGDSKPMGLGGTPFYIGIYLDNKTTTTSPSSPATCAALVRCIQEALAVEPDNALLTGIIEACHRNAIETTGEPANEEELIYFTASKARVISRAPNIRNHLAVLRKAVPECFLGESFRAYRAAAALRKQKLTEGEQRSEAERAQRQREAAEAEARYALWAQISEIHKGEQGYDMQAIANDPNLDDLGKQQAKRLIERLGRYTPSGL